MNAEKTENVEALNTLRRAMGTPEMRALVGVLTLRLNALKDMLVTSGPNETPTYQGRAQALHTLLQDIQKSVTSTETKL